MPPHDPDPAAAFVEAARETLDWRRAAAEGDVAGAIEALTALDPIAYDRVREEAAGLLGCRVVTLDREVTKRRGAKEDRGPAGSPVTFDDPEPWPEPVDPAELLAELEAYFTRHAVLPGHGAVVLALWTAHTWVFDTGPVTPRLAVTSPQKGCGKSTVLDLLAAVVRRPLEASHATTAALFRVIEKHRPTILLDEADTFLGDNEELRGLLNAGHHHRGRVLRAVPVGEDFEPRAFHVFAPVAIAAIGRLPGTLADRSVVLRMQRRRPGERVEPLRGDRAELHEPLRRRLARFAADFAARLREADPPVPSGLANRVADNWRPLFAIADLAGGPWPDRARAAALAQLAEAADEELPVLLLGDIREIFDASGEAEIASTELCERLAAREDRPWAEISRGRPITPRKLASLLRPFGIHPLHRERARVYRRADFEEAWARYLPGPPSGDDEPSFRQEPYDPNVSRDLQSVRRERGADTSRPGGPVGAVCPLMNDISRFPGSADAAREPSAGPLPGASDRSTGGRGRKQSVIHQEGYGPNGSADFPSVGRPDRPDTSREGSMFTVRRPADGMTLRAPEGCGSEDHAAPDPCPSCSSARWWRPRGDVPWRCWACDPPPAVVRPGFQVLAVGEHGE